jgi:hypothetical protein
MHKDKDKDNVFCAVYVRKRKRKSRYLCNFYFNTSANGNASLVPCPIIRELHCYRCKCMKLQSEITSTLQEIERTLEMCNIRITSLVSNISGKSIRKQDSCQNCSFFFHCNIN